MKLKKREIFMLIGLISVAIALPLSIWLVMKSQETRSQAGEVRAYVSRSIKQNTVCPSNIVGYNLGCFKHPNDAIIAAQARGESKTIIEIEAVADWKNAYDWQMVVEKRTVNSSEYEIVLKSASTSVTPKFFTKTNSGMGHVLHINDPRATVSVQSLELRSDLTNSIIHAYNAKALNLTNVGVYSGKAAGVFYGDLNNANSSANGTVINSTFIGNTWSGVSVHGVSSVVVKNSTFKDHQHTAADVTDTAKLEIHSSTFTGDNIKNEDGSRGSVRASRNGKLLLRSSTISNSFNYGVILVDSAQGTIINNVIKDNAGLGIGLWNDSRGTIKNNIITNNSYYGGIYLSANSLLSSLENNVVSGNLHLGLDIDSNDVGAVKNNIFINNGTGTDPDQCDSESNIYIESGVNPSGIIDTFSYNDIYGGKRVAMSGCGNSYTLPASTNTLLVDPVFKPDNSYQPQVGSPMINAGDPSITDINGSRSDIGLWGGQNADWSPVFTKNLAYTCDGGFTLGYKEYNDPQRKYTGASGALYEKLPDGKYKQIVDVVTTGSTTENVTISIPASLVDGKSHTLSFAAYNISKYTDLNNQEVYTRQDNTFGLQMNVQSNEITFKCGSAPVNTPPTFTTEIKDQNAYIGQVFTYGIEFTDADGDAVTSTATIPAELSGWLTKSAQSTNGKLVLTGTPVATSPKGTFKVDLKLEDGKNTVNKSFNVTVGEVPSTAVLLNLRINLQVREDESNESVQVKVANKTGAVVFQTSSASNSDGFLTTMSLTGVTPGEYDIWVKPRGYLARKISKTLVVGENKITMPNEFLAGDIHEDYTFNVVKSADYVMYRSMLSTLEDRRDEIKKQSIADFSGDGYVTIMDYTIMRSNWMPIVGDSL